ncbi:MAG: 30S ribosomal protein S20 [Desulfosarcina sp.]|nr:30S ribosomal protein S20 [Desulfosarcina sp.]
MANHKSALKRAGQNERRRLRNKAVQTRVKNVVVIDNAAKKGVLHKKTASRKISRLAKQVNAQQA